MDIEAEPKKKKKWKWLFILLLLLVMAVGGYWWTQRIPADFYFDKEAKNGLIEARTQEDVQKILDQIVEKGMFNASINPNPIFYDGKSEGDLWIENIKANHYYTKVKIVLDKTKEQVFESGGIKPDQNIQSARLDKDLKKGTYPATASFHIIEPNDLKEIGVVNVKLTMTIQH